MALTLIEAAKEIEDDFRATVVEVFASQHPLLQVLPFEPIMGGAKRVNREGTLPDVGFRAINAGYTPSEGTLEPVTEPLLICGGDLDVDTFLVAIGGPGVRANREKMKLKSLAHRFAHAVVKGSNTADGREFDGLQVRALGNQLVSNSASTGAALSLFNLDTMIARVPGANYLVMSNVMVTRLSQAARTTTVGGFVTYTTNEFGQRITMYNGIPIIEVGGPGHVYATLDFTEAAAGGGTASTSIYALRIGTGGVTGIWNAPPFAKDLGELQTAPVFRTRFDWYAGLGNEDVYSLGRLYGITNAAVVA